MHLICGINPVLEALGARERHFDRLLVVKGLRNRRVSEAIARASHLGIPLRFEAREMLDRMAAGVPHQGVIAVVSAKPLMDLDSVLDQAKTPALLVVLDGVEDPRNLGAIIRTAEAAGADGVALPERHSAGLSETVARASAGALEHVRVAQIGNVVQALERLKARGVWVVGFDAAGTERWDAVDLKRPVALVLGGEGRGIRRLVREHCDHLVSLPLFGHVGSLNVSVAAGIALYEVVRQRGAVPSHVRPIPPKALAAASRVIGPAADDGEHDPGRHGREHEAHGGAAEDEHEETPERLVILDEEDSAWWAAAPAGTNGGERQGRPSAPAERARHTGGGGARHGRRDRDGRRGGRHGREDGRHGRGDARPAGGEGREHPADARPHPEGGRGAEQGRGRRRKRGRGRPPAPGGAEPRHGGESRRGPGAPSPESPSPASGAPDEPRHGPERPAEGASGGRPEGGGHRRRRRRRRH
ncbi:MAG TPA: 23S rRNA (guanosine(2251)-2'-O)-methyltransferase RlmB [Vicinamibacteria bacterium]